jgi:hypothetical protein
VENDVGSSPCSFLLLSSVPGLFDLYFAPWFPPSLLPSPSSAG